MLASSTVKFAGYRVEGIAGRGGMGVVYRATQLGLDRPVALKVVAAGLLGDPRIRERFLRESRAAAAIEHPNVIPIHDYGECDGRAYIAMRFVDGDDLRERVTATGPLAPQDAAAIVAHVADGLDAAHDAGLVHRDVKPANILLGAHDQVYLSDFGLASHALSEGGLTSPGGWVGTMDFMAPEQIRGEPVDLRADVYALGCVLHFALTGQVAYPRETDEARLWAHLHAAPPEPSRLVPGVPAAFDEVIRRALEKRPDARSSSAGELGAAALTAAGHPTVARTKRTAAPRRAPSATSATWPDAAPARPAPARPRGGRSDGRRCGRPRRLPLDPRLRKRRSPDQRAAEHHDDRGRGGQAARRQGARHPRPARRPRRPRRHAAGQRRGRRRQRLGGQHGVTDARPRRARAVTVATVGHTSASASRTSPTGAGELWVTVAASRQVVRVRASTGSQIGTPIAMIGQPRAIDAGEGAVWVAEQSPYTDNLVEIDPHTATVVGRLAVPEGINDIRAANGAVWVLGRHKPVLIKVSAPTRQRIVTLPMGRHAERVDVAAGFVWVTDYGDDAVTRVDPKGPKIVTTDVPGRPYGLRAREDGVWVACYGDQSVVRIDPHTDRVVGKPIRVGFNPVGVDVRGHSAWVTSVADDRLTRIDFG